MGAGASCSSDASISDDDRLDHLRRTPFFLILSKEQLKEFAECFASVTRLKAGQQLSLNPGCTYVVAEGELELSTTLPDHKPSKLDNKGFLCKKRPGDIISKKSTQREAERRLRLSLKKFHSYVDEITTTACQSSVLLCGDQGSIDAFLSSHPDLALSIHAITRLQIEDYLSQIPFLQDVKRSQLSLLAAMSRYEAFDADVDIFQEGSSGSKIYIILNGEAAVFANGGESDLSLTSDGKGESNNDGRRATALQRSLEMSGTTLEDHVDIDDTARVKIADLKSGDYFGETALMVHIPRTTTVRTKAKSLFVTVDKTDFDNFLKVCPIKDSMTRVMKERMVSKLSSLGIPFLAGITDEKVHSLSSSVQIHEFHEGKVVFREGDVGDRFYIIVHGEAKIETQMSSPGPEAKADESVENAKPSSLSPQETPQVTDLGRIGPGKYFGEMALVSESPRSATVILSKKAVLLSLGRESFHELFASDSQACAEFRLRLLKGEAQLHHLLDHELGFSTFQSYLQNSLADENLDFWMKAKAFQQSGAATKDDMKKAAVDLYSTFCDETSEKQVNLPSNICTAIKHAIENDEIHVNLFESAEAEIYKLMVRDNYYRFKNTSDFKDFFRSLGVFLNSS